MTRKWTAGLSPIQCSIVVGVFFATSIGAALLVLAMRQWNKFHDSGEA